MALGALLVIVGVYGLVSGLPYLVLERGFTQAIIGSVMVNAGLVLFAIGMMMRDLRRLASRLEAPLKGDAARDAIAASALAAGGVAAGALAAGAQKAKTQADMAEAAPEDGVAPPEDFIEAAADTAGQPGMESFDKGDVDVGGIGADGAGDAAEAPPAPADDGADADYPASGAPQPDPASPEPSLPAPPDDEDDPFEKLRRSLMLGDKPSRSEALAAGMAGIPTLPPTAALEVTAPDAAPPAGAEVLSVATAVVEDAGAAAAPEALPEPGPPAGPTASEEGIVSVRRIGDSTYTMYADGSVTAETPGGLLRFASVAELKAHLLTLPPPARDS